MTLWSYTMLTDSARPGAGAGSKTETQVPKPMWDTGAGLSHRNTTFFGAPGRNRTCDTRFRKHRAVRLVAFLPPSQGGNQRKKCRPVGSGRHLQGAAPAS